MELLVVVAIIAVLAGLLLPALATARSKAQVAKCQGNLRQIDLGLLMYVNDNRRYPPDFEFAGPPFRTDRFDDWLSLIQPYTRAGWTNPLMHCPADKTPNTLPIIELTGVISGRASYAYNYDGTGQIQLNSQTEYLGLEERSETTLVSPADMVSHQEVWWWVSSNPGFYYHRTGGNCSFSDGHVEYLRLPTLRTTNPAVRSRWNYDHQPHPETWQGR